MKSKDNKIVKTIVAKAKELGASLACEFACPIAQGTSR